MAYAFQFRIPTRTLQAPSAWRRWRQAVVPTSMLLLLIGPDWMARGERAPAALVVAVTLAVAVYLLASRVACPDGVPSRLRLALGPVVSLLAAAVSVGVFAYMAHAANALVLQTVTAFVEASVVLAVLHVLPVPPLAAGWALLRVVPNAATDALFVRGVAGECLLLALFVLPVMVPGMPALVTIAVDAGQDFVLGVLGVAYRAL